MPKITKILEGTMNVLKDTYKKIFLVNYVDMFISPLIRLRKIDVPWVIKFWSGVFETAYEQVV